MKERPIIFNDEMVRAILSGTKTMTRRPMKVQPELQEFGLRFITESNRKSDEGKYFWSTSDGCGLELRSKLFLCPYGKPGDHIWVREAFNGYWLDDDVIQEIKDGISSANELCDYRADYSDGMKAADGWTPSIHMPRWASRITLEITDVRVERLKSISEADARAEGVVAASGPFEAQLAFYELWRSIYGWESWDSNPWVWVIAFRRVEQ